MSVKLTRPEYNAEEWNAYYDRRTERVRAFDEAVRDLAYQHGFWGTHIQVNENRAKGEIEVALTFQMDNRIPPKDREVAP